MDIENIRLIDQNFLFHATHVPSQYPEMQTIHSVGFSYANTGLSCDTFNIIHVTDGKLLNLDALTGAIEKYRKNGLEFCLWAHEYNLTPDLEKQLADLNLSQNGEEVGMRLILDNYEKIASPKQEKILAVNSEERLQSFSQVLAANWTPPDANVIKYYHKTRNAYLTGNHNIQLLLFHEGENALATCELFPTDDDTVGIYGLATLEDARGQGIGSALMTYCLNLAKDTGYKNVVLQATEDGLGIYEKLGFKAFGKYFEYG